MGLEGSCPAQPDPGQALTLLDSTWVPGHSRHGDVTDWSENELEQHVMAFKAQTLAESGQYINCRCAAGQDALSGEIWHNVRWKMELFRH